MSIKYIGKYLFFALLEIALYENDRNKMGIRKKSFDECFLAFPETTPPEKFKKFWQNALDELKKVPVSPKRKLLIKKSIGLESRQEITYFGYGTHALQAYLSIPRKRSKVPAIISFHDYADTNSFNKIFTEAGFAHLAVIFRGHKKTAFPKDPQIEVQSPHLIDAYGIETVEESYLYAVILDAVRSVDLLRLEKEIDSSNIGIIGNGFGAAAAIFAACLKKENIQALVLERPGFFWMPVWLKESISMDSKELSESLRKSKSRTKTKKNLELLDAVNLLQEVKIPVMVSACMDDANHPPYPAFGFFNRLLTEKYMEIYPEENSDPDQQIQRKKSVEFIKAVIMNRISS
ncbi:MAG: acetylxylan esterase [Spirochaetia bacterium]|nr:acetylxylan esterase [Spirochaetia bacterium]